MVFIFWMSLNLSTAKSTPFLTNSPPIPAPFVPPVATTVPSLTESVHPLPFIPPPIPAPLLPPVAVISPPEIEIVPPAPTE